MTTIVESLAEGACENTDRELWRERFGDFYANSIHVTKDGSIGINVSGNVIVMPLQKWHALAGAAPAAQPRKHITDGSECWCHPDVDYIDPETGAKVIVHKEVQ